jgi:radical SAM superfamily enzyme YgiQ (UPF0313 family)
LTLRQILDHPEILDAAVECGLTTSTVGIQCGCERVAREVYRRRIPNDVLRRAAELMLEKGLNVNYATIEGNPLVSEEDFEEHLQFMANIPFDPSRCLLCVHKLKNLPETPLTKRIENEGLLGEENDSWYYKGLLTYARPLLNDDDFENVRQSPIFKKRPELLEDLIERFTIDKVMELESITYDESIMRKVYQRRLRHHHTDDIIVWWSKEHYPRYQEIFESYHVIALVSSDPAVQGQIVDGAEIVGPDFIANKKNIPIFICSPHKRAIVAEINKEHGPGHLLY